MPVRILPGVCYFRSQTEYSIPKHYRDAAAFRFRLFAVYGQRLRHDLIYIVVLQVASRPTKCTSDRSVRQQSNVLVP